MSAADGVSRAYRIRYWTRPTQIAHYASRIEIDFPGARDGFEGTEHVYFIIPAADSYEAIEAVWRKWGKSFTQARLA